MMVENESKIYVSTGATQLNMCVGERSRRKERGRDRGSMRMNKIIFS